MDRDNDSTATQANPRITRRGVMRKTAIGVGAAATVGVGVSHPRGIVGESEAVAPLIGLGVIGGSVGLGWALRATEVLGSDAPPEGLTAGALKQQVHQTVRTRKSTNASTIVDNQNILDGVENNAYTEAKIAAIEQLNAGATETEVLDAATAAIDSYETTISKNILKTWNESVSELEMMISTIQSHPDVSVSNVFKAQVSADPSNLTNAGSVGFANQSVSLSDGTTFDLKTLQKDGKAGQEWDPLGSNGGYDYRAWLLTDDGSGLDFTYLAKSDWAPIWSEMKTTFQNVRDGISTWVTNVYGEVQSGEIEISSLITPSVRADMLSDEETEASAIADLVALNIPIDPEREATITITETSATLSGTIALTDTSDGPIESGTTYDPSTFTGDVYFTTDVSKLSGKWSAFQSGVDGGKITFTSQPYEGTVYKVTTTAGETVSVPASDFTDNGDGTYSYDASGGLETDITEVDSVAYESASSETQFETLNISKQFTVKSLVNRETGEEASSASFESSEPQTDSNYITQEEWNQLEQRNKELIEKYEESQTTAGGGGGFLSGGGGDAKTLGIVAGGAALAALLFGNN